jgi:cytochrome c biogenesis protein CcdA
VLAVFAAGVLVGLCTVPCSGAIYLAVLGLLARQATYLSGLGYLVPYHVVFVAPLVAMLAVAAPARSPTASAGGSFTIARHARRGLASRQSAWG